MIQREHFTNQTQIRSRSIGAAAVVFALLIFGTSPSLAQAADVTSEQPAAESTATDNPVIEDSVPIPTAPLPAPTTGNAELVTLERTPDGSLRTGSVVIGADLSGLEALSSLDLVAVDTDVTFHVFGDDPHRSEQWALDRTTFESASSSLGGASAVVAVLDTGIRGTHEDLADVLLPGADFVLGSGSGLVPDHFHGSHVAGIIAANADNSLGIAGAAGSLQILPVRVLDGSGSGSSANVANGIIWATDQGADVINLSLGSTSNSLVVESAIDYAISHGVVVVAAAGNSGNVGNPMMYPAALDAVISVSAIDTDDTRAQFSSYGSWIDIAAPGVSILSLHNASDTNYAYANGTSMAAPYVAAAAGLLKAADPALTVTDIRNILHATAEDLGAAGKDSDFGYGLVDPSSALAAIGTDPDGGVQPPPDSGYSFVTNFGRVLSQGLATEVGSLAGVQLAQPVVFAANTPSGNGYWLVASDGGIFAFGDAAFYGSAGDIALAKPVVGMAATPSGNGYWLVASDGGIFAFGDAAFYGSTGAITLREPIVGMAATPTGNGYWLVASDGGIFAFGDAVFYGSTGAITLAEPVVNMAKTPGRYGYWLTAADGGLFSFGDARFAGSVAGQLQAGEHVVALIDPTFG